MIVIPMAGESRRFRLGGYTEPKYMLPLDSRPLFDWSVLSFRDVFASERFVFVCRDVAETPGFVAERVTALGIVNAIIVVLDRPTAGQAETVELGLRDPRVGEGPLGIFNIDTLRPGAGRMIPSGEGWLETFTAEGEGWSFVEPALHEPGRVLRTTEKQRISDECCTGYYWFARTSNFKAALAAERLKPSAPELYVAPLFNWLIEKEMPVRFERATDVLFSGVPAEYEALLGEPGRVAGLPW